MPKTKNIIFDLGGVLLNIDYDRTSNAFKQLGFAHFENLYSQYSANDFFKKLERGEISDEEFYNTLIKEHDSITAQDIKEAWNAMLLDFRLNSLGFLKKLSENHRLFLLSNTNAIHYSAFMDLFTSETGIASLDSFFSTAYYSHQIGLRKPDEEIFKFVLEDAGINASESLFIDDSYNNIEAAAAMDFKTHLLVNGETIENLDYSL